MAEPQIGKTFAVKSRLKPKSKKPSSTSESKYWRSFKTQQISNLIYPITSIEFSPLSPNDFAATFSASVTLYSSQTFEPKSTISSFNDIAYSATFRSDGKLLAAGGESGLVQVFDLKTRSPLRRLNGHYRPVRVVRYPKFDNLHLFSGGDDSLVKYWDVASETELLNFQGHKDYVRSGSVSPVSSDLIATGSYDHTVKLWDSRVSSMNFVLNINHGKPVEDVVFMPSGGLIATAGGNSVKIWDVIGGGKLVYAMESHNKTVTSMCVGKVSKDGIDDQFRLLSVSLDGYMKVFDYSALKVTHSMRYPAPLLSVGVSPDSSVRVIGTSNGVIFAGKRKKKDVDGGGNLGELVGFGSVEEPQKRVLRPTNFRYFHRSQNEKPSEGDYLIKRQAKVKLTEHDKLLRKFRHKEALVSALNGKNPQNVVAVMEELVARKKLLKCVSNLDGEELGLLLYFLHKYSTMPRYSGFLVGLTKKVLQLRAEDIRVSDALKGHVKNLKRSVEEELRIQHSLQEIQGIISPLMRIAGRR
ncbi:WD40 repeat [Macleaya cordata]|uniref:WD40 repeat n=1 Tax=Macleaya cordata TaxID=56857 RepID=A0A200QLQ1_MACCD|nr:WD40 repeat [Macleaya cordata]